VNACTFEQKPASIISKIRFLAVTNRDFQYVPKMCLELFLETKKKSFATLNLTLTSSTYYISSYFLWNGLLVPYKRHSHNIIAILFRFPSLLIAMSSLPTHLIITFFLNSNLASYCIYNFHCECEFLDRNGILQKLKKICYSSNNK
jgi:hypothetical protein